VGKTAVEIRDMASKPGGIPVDQIWNPLVNGLQEKFGGAAANVKETFAGAIDRVKAAWRDFSSELATPLVDPDGGGALVDFLNGLADAMRQFEKLPEPVKNATTNITLAGGAALLAGGTFLLTVPKIAALRAAMVDLNITAAGTKSALAAATPALIAFAAVPIGAELAKSIDDMRGVTASASDLEKQLRNAGVAGSDLERGLTGGNALRGMGMDAVYATDNLRALNTGVGQLKAWFDNTMLGEALSIPMLGFGRETGKAKQQIEELDAAMSSMVASGQVDEAAEAHEYFAKMAGEAGWSAERIADALPEYTSAMENAAPATKTSAELASSAASALTEQADAARAATDEIFKLIDTLMESNSVAQTAEGANARYQKTLADVAEYVAQAQAGVEGYSLSLDANTVEGSKNREMLAGMAGDSQAAALALYEQEVNTLGVDRATENYNTRLAQGREALMKTLEQFGITGDAAKAYADEIYRIPTEHELKIMAETALASEQVRRFISGLPQTFTVFGNVAWGESAQNASSALNHGADGFIEAYADGGFATGIYKGGAPIHKFAEPETRWEAFISGKPGQEDRNRQIWVETGRRLGMSPGGESSAQPVVYVQNPFTGEYLLAKVDDRAGGVVAAASSAGGSRVSRGTDRRF